MPSDLYGAVNILSLFRALMPLPKTVGPGVPMNSGTVNGRTVFTGAHAAVFRLLLLVLGLLPRLQQQHLTSNLVCYLADVCDRKLAHPALV